MLIDDIIKPGVIINESELDMPVMGDMLRTSYVLNATNVAENIAEMTRGKLDIRRDLPNVAPPFENMFIEWSRKIEGEVSRYAMLINSCDREKHPHAEVWDREFRGIDARWSCNGHLFMFNRDRSTVIWEGHFFWGVMSDGSFALHREIISTESMGGAVKVGDNIDGGIICTPSVFAMDVVIKELGGSSVPVEEAANAVTNIISNMAMIPLMSICFLHAKNVTVQKSPAPTQHQMKAWRKKEKPLFRYHTITINQKATHAVGGGGHSGPHGHSAVHICRGHFKKFTPEKPLLGKHVGVYWWPMILRGSKEEGVVIKDYKIE